MSHSAESFSGSQPFMQQQMMQQQQQQQQEEFMRQQMMLAEQERQRQEWLQVWAINQVGLYGDLIRVPCHYRCSNSNK
jgi:hypothetical protein